MAEKIYDAKGGRELFIDDFTDVESVEILDSYGNVYETIPVTDYALYPQGEDVMSSIYLIARNFPNRRGSVRVTGTFSSGDLPSGVIMATTHLVAQYLTEARVGGKYVGAFKSESIEGYRYELANGGTSLDAKTSAQMRILDSYRRLRI